MIPTNLIENALSLTGKKMEDIQDPYIIYDDDYSIEEFAYYLFDDVVLQAIKEAWQKDFPKMQFQKIDAIQWLWSCISEYQSWRSSNLISLLEKIWKN